MAKEYTKGFYSNAAWRSCRESYLKSVGGLCEPCLNRGIYTPADTVHHKIHVSPDNINNPDITLNFDNLLAVCRDCHAEQHKRKKRYRIDESGRVMI